MVTVVVEFRSQKRVGKLTDFVWPWFSTWWPWTPHRLSWPVTRDLETNGILYLVVYSRSRGGADVRRRNITTIYVRSRVIILDIPMRNMISIIFQSHFQLVSVSETMQWKNLLKSFQKFSSYRAKYTYLHNCFTRRLNASLAFLSPSKISIKNVDEFDELSRHVKVSVRVTATFGGLRSLSASSNKT